MKNKIMMMLLLVVILSLPLNASHIADKRLQCKPDGTFKVVMFSDTHYVKEIEPLTTDLIEKVLDEEKPDMVVMGGDCISGAGVDTVEQLKKAISYVAYPMEKREIPWAIVFGNHDQEHFPKTRLSKEQTMKIYESYPWNVNRGWQKGISGVGNKAVIIRDNKGKYPVFV